MADSKKNPKDSSLTVFKRPPDPTSLQIYGAGSSLTKKRKSKVLDEDEYVDKVSKIIERDFFPELEKLKAQSEYIDAKERQDDATIARLEARFSTPMRRRATTPSSFETPEIPGKDTEDHKTEDVSGEESEVKEDSDTPKMSLDKFLLSHTSEDNESFNELMEESRKEFQKNNEWMFKKDEQLSIEMKKEQLCLPSPEEQVKNAASRKSKGALDGWTYKNVNAVFYNPEGAELTTEEKVELAKKERKVILDNTRFTKNPWKKSFQNESIIKTSIAKQEANLGKVGVDGKNIVERQGTPSINGYKLMRMNNPTPQIGPDESPMMTWGEVESTPYRLEGCETPLLSMRDHGPSFKIQDVPKRDRIALELAEKNSKFHRDKKGKAIQKAKSNLKTGNLSRLSSMSPAAQRLASSKLGIRLGTDKVLSAAYTPSPARTPSSCRTPSNIGTPRTSSSKARISSSIKLGTGLSTPKVASLSKSSEETSKSSITDDLLNLPTTRKKAADFF